MELVNTWQFNNYIGTATQAAINAGGIINGWTITSEPTIGQVITTGTPEQVFYQMYRQTQKPTAGLTGSVSQEWAATGSNLSSSLAWSYGKQANTANIVSANIVGNATTYPVFGAQPAANSSITGNQAVSYPRNTTTTFTLTVTTADAKTEQASAVMSFYHKRYAGFDQNALVSDLPANSDILAASFQDNNGGTVPLTLTIAQQGSDKHFFYVTTSPVSSVTLNGFPSTAAFNLNTPVSVTNAIGGIFTYYVTVSKNAFGSVGATTLIFN